MDREARQLQVLHAKLAAWQSTIERATLATVTIALARVVPGVVVTATWGDCSYARSFDPADVDTCACVHARLVIAEVLARRGV